MTQMKEYIKQLIFFAKGYEYLIFALLALAIIIGLIDALSVSLLYPMLSVGFQIKTDSIPMYDLVIMVSSIIPIGSQFVHLGFLFIILTGISLGLQLIYWRVAFILQKKIIIGIKRSIFRKIETNDYRFFVDSKQGDLINLFNQSPFNIQITYDKLLSFCTDFVSSLTVIIMLFFISPIGLLLVSIGGVLFYFIIHTIGKNISEKLGYLQIASGQSENKVINEYISGIKPIKSLNASEHWKNQYEKALKIYWDQFAEFMFIQRIPIIAINSMFYIAIGIVVLVLYIYYADNFLSVIPILGTFAAGMMKILPKLMNLGTYKLDLKNSQPHLDAVYRHLRDNKYNKTKSGKIICTEINSDIILNGVSFSYGHGQTLNHINLTIKKGCMTALVGPSGSGKSTITSLILRLFDPISGEIFINEVNLKEYDIGSYRNLIGYVSQEPFIFNDTIRENITFGGNFSNYELFDAAKLANAHEFIMELPQGYDTVVGDQGVTLSGGEKQRIAIARAMIRDPELLILDEATSSLDNISENLVQAAIDKVAKNCTTLVIAHRLSTIRQADLIVVLKNGHIVESGTHSELLEIKGNYWELNKITNTE